MFLPGVYCTGTLESSQIVLHETSNIIDIYIGAHNSPLCTSWNGGLAITGIENMAGTIFYTPPGQNGTVFTAINQGWRFTPNGANFPWGYVWTGPTGVVGTLSSATVCPTVSTTYTVTATTTAACGLVTISNTSLVTSVVSPVTITGPNNTCVGKTITLSSSTSSGTWSSSNTSVATVIGGIVTGVSVGTTTISYTSGSCSGSYNITVNPIYNTTLNATICQGQSYNFLGTGLTLPGVYKDTLYSIYGCDSSFTLNLNVNPTFNTNIFDTICDNQTYNFFGSVLNINGIYNHTLSTINGCDSIISLHLLVHPTYHNFTSALICQGDSYSFGGDFYNSGGNYTKNFPSVYGCDSIVTLNLTVYPKPDASFYVSPYKCIGDTITVALDHISSDVISYFWDFNPASVLYYSGLSGPYDITYNSSGIYTISLIVSNIYCTDTTKDTLQIMNYPNARIAPAIYLNGSSDVCIGDEIILQSLYKQNGWLYYWTPSYVLDDPNVAAVRATIPSDSISISLNIMNAFGCKATDSIKIKAESCCLILVPSAFTPNGDGINDIFRIINRHSIKLHSFEIVNRFGQSVFETYDLSKGWDGTFGGVPQDLGVYFYYILYECEGKQLELKGDLTLIR
jgi:gliding motility-associated-like protein